MIRGRQKILPLGQLTRTAVIKRMINLAIEMSVLIATVGILIYYLVVGDPHNRLMSCIGTIVAFGLPWAVELIRGRRFSFMQHIFYDIYMFMSMFLGMVVFLHHSVPPYDEIMHVMFGYFACLAIFYGFLHTKALDESKVLSAVVIFIFISMGTAAVWECMEFGMDVLLGQNSLGFPSSQVVEYIAEQGLSGIEANMYALRNTSVMDTVSDMALHFVGTFIFAVQLFIHKHWGKCLMLGSLTKEWQRDQMNTPVPTKEVINIKIY